MLQLKGIKKSYEIGDFAQVALNSIDLNFRQNEFVAILGPSGSGKTTCLNILGGLDRYDEGDLIISGKSTKDFRDRDWDAYRNNSVGFIFQNYNLIPHLNLIDNVEMGMTLSGINAKKKREKALEVLERVGLEAHVRKKPTQLSGGQMQRVAIARALANEPDIILADEPTGALDTETSEQIMTLIKEIAKDKLVIMVTHNPELAEAYADRTIRFQDGNVIYDSHPPTGETLKERIIRYENGGIVYDSEATQIFKSISSEEPDIILTETPTNNLGSKTDAQIINAVKEAINYEGGRLVVRVTKFPTLPLHSDDRLIHCYNGQLIDPIELTRQIGPDEMALINQNETEEYRLTKTSMNYLMALKLSGKNIIMKKWRTTLTILALSIGLIGVAIVLALSNGFNQELAQFEAGALMDFPISIHEEAIDWDRVGLFTVDEEPVTLESRTDRDVIYVNRPEERDFMHRNIMTDELFEHIEALDPIYVRSITYTYRMNLNLLRQVDDEVITVRLETSATGMGAGFLPTLPQPFNEGEMSFLYRTHELLAGEYPSEMTDLVLIIDEFNRVNASVLDGLGFDIEELEQLTFEDLVGLELRLIPNNDFYIETDQGNFVMNPDMEELYDHADATVLTIVGVFRQKDDDTMQLFSPGILHSDELTRDVIAREIDSDIVQAQLEADYNVLTLATQSEEEQRWVLSSLGGRVEPVSINIFPYPTFEAKDAIMAHLNAFNDDLMDDEYRIIYEDQASIATEAMSELLNIITIILVAFSAISLVVSLVMIAIITYISVMERTKEIGILRALGARKRDITRIFIAEVIIIGLFSGVFSLIMTYLFSLPINLIVSMMTNLNRVASLSLLHGIVLVLLSLGLTILAGFIPARIAAKKNPVDALRSE